MAKSKKYYNEGGRQSKNIQDMRSPKENAKQMTRGFLDLQSLNSDRQRDKTPISKQYKNGSKPGKSIFDRKMEPGSNDELLNMNQAQAKGANGDDGVLAGPGPGSPPSKFEKRKVKASKKPIYSFFKHTTKEK